jgi:hypothetical protein
LWVGISFTLIHDLHYFEHIFMAWNDFSWIQQFEALPAETPSKTAIRYW